MDTIFVYRDKKGELRWRYVREGNNETMADSGEGYASPDAVEDALMIVFAPRAVSHNAAKRLDLIKRGSRQPRYLRVSWPES